MITKISKANIDVNRFYWDVVSYITTAEGKNEIDIYMLVRCEKPTSLEVGWIAQ